MEMENQYNTINTNIYSLLVSLVEPQDAFTKEQQGPLFKKVCDTTQ